MGSPPSPGTANGPGGALLDPQYMVLDVKVYPVTEETMDKLSLMNTLSLFGSWVVGMAVATLLELWLLRETESDLSDKAEGFIAAGMPLSIAVALIFGAVTVWAQFQRKSTTADLKKRARTRELHY